MRKLAAAALLCIACTLAPACATWRPLALDGVIAKIYPLTQPAPAEGAPRAAVLPPAGYVLIITTSRGPQQVIVGPGELAGIATLSEGDQVQLVGTTNPAGTRARWTSLRRGASVVRPHGPGRSTTL